MYYTYIVHKGYVVKMTENNDLIIVKTTFDAF